MASKKEVMVPVFIDHGLSGQQTMQIPMTSRQGPTRISLRGGKAKVLIGDTDDVAPDELSLQRQGDDLMVMFDGSDPEHGQLLLEGFYEQSAEAGDEQKILAGMAETGEYHHYVSSVNADHFDLAQLAPGGVARSALGNTTLDNSLAGALSGTTAAAAGGLGAGLNSGNGMLPILGGIGLGGGALVGLIGGGGGGGGGGGSTRVNNFVDFNNMDFRTINGDLPATHVNILTKLHSAVFTGGLRISSQGRTTVELDSSGTSSALKHNWTMRIEATKGGMSEVSFKLTSIHNIAVKYYDAEGNHLYSEIVSALPTGAAVRFTPPAGKQISYFTVGGTSLQDFTIDDINYTVNGASSLVNFTNAVFKYADGTTETANYFELGSVFLGTLEINSDNTMFRGHTYGTGNSTATQNHLAVYSNSTTTFTLHKQNVFTVKFDAEFRGDNNEIVFYDADNNEIGRISRGKTPGHGDVNVGAKQWEQVQFDSTGAAIAYFIVKAGNGAHGIAFDNLSYPQSNGPGARVFMALADDEAAVDEVSELTAQSLAQEPTVHDQVIALRQDDALGSPALLMADKPALAAADPFGIGDIDRAGDGINILNLSVGDLLNHGGAALFSDSADEPLRPVTADGDDQIVLSDFNKVNANSEEALAAAPGDANYPIYEHSGLHTELLVGGVGSQLISLV